VLPPSATAASTLAPPTQINLTSADLRGTIIHFWHNWSGPTGNVVKSLIEEFNLHNEWGILVVPVYQPTLDVLSNNLEAAIQAGNPPDLVIGYPHQILAWDASKKLVNLRAYVEDPAWGFTSLEQSDFYPIFWNQDVFDGQRLGIPAQRTGQVLFYNTTWAKELGFSAPPASTKQFAEQACTATHASQTNGDANAGSGGWIISTDYTAMLGWIFAFGGDIVKTPKPGVNQSAYQFNTPQIKEAFTFLRNLYDQKCAWLTENQVPTTDFANRMGLFATGSITDISQQAEAFKQAGDSDQWTILPFPSSDAKPSFDIYGPSFAMLGSTPQRQLASWLFIKWLIDPKNQARLIEASGALPLRVSTLNYLEKYKGDNPQWAAAVGFLLSARSEPSLQSWSTVRWALNDASTQLFRSYQTVDQVPKLLTYLDQTAKDLQLGPELSGAYSTLTPTSRPGVKASPTPANNPTVAP